jgi:hypothetical protein
MAEEIPTGATDDASAGDSGLPCGNPVDNDVDRGLALIAAGAGLVSGARMYALSDAEVRGAVVRTARVQARVDAAFLDLVAALDSRPEAVPGTRPGQGAAAFLHQAVLRSPGQAFRDVAAARAIDGIGLDAGGPAGAGVGGAGVGGAGVSGAGEDGGAGVDGRSESADAVGDSQVEGGVADPADPGSRSDGSGEAGGSGGLPVMVAAFRSGQVSRQHLDVAVRTLGKVPAHLASKIYPDGRSGSERVDSYLTEHSRVFPPSGTERLGRHLLAVMDPDGLDRFDPAAFRRRSLTCSIDGTGMLVGRFQLDPASGACLKAALDRFSAPHPAVSVTSHDDRSPADGPVPGEGGGQATDDTTGGATVQHGSPAGDGDAEQGVLIPDLRTLGQRQADGLTALARLAMAADQGTVRAEPPHILILATPDQVTAATRRRERVAVSRSGPAAGRRRPAHDGTVGDVQIGSSPAAGGAGAGAVGAGAEGVEGRDGNSPAADAQPRPGEIDAARGLAECVQTGLISSGTLGRFLCDAVLQAVVLDDAGAVLNLGRRVRSATRAQRTALTARDRGCCIPGCPAAPSMCEPHHVKEWSRGGLTDLQNLALLCSTHHTAVHAEHWQLKMLGGVPWAIPPAWLDPSRRPIRRRICDAEDQARKLALPD